MLSGKGCFREQVDGLRESLATVVIGCSEFYEASCQACRLMDPVVCRRSINNMSDAAELQMTQIFLSLQG
jgi:hypothetical protein